MILFYLGLCIGAVIGFIVRGLFINASRNHPVAEEKKVIEVDSRPLYTGRFFIGEC
jgi:hypothetical protein